MPEKVLFVDDENNVLSALKRQFRKQYEVSTALGGARGLQLLDSEGPFAVIVSDMQMPEMNGVEFLQKAGKIAPDSVRIMLTGNADQQTAMNAVNDGNIFSFLTKPCPPETLVNAMNEAIEQYRLITAERELLEGTLNGSVKLLMDMLSMIAPDSFGRTIAITETAGKLADAMQLENTWNLRLAAMLSNLACVTLPPETLAKHSKGEELTSEEQQMVTRLPEVSKKLITNIPRLEQIADIVLYHQKSYNGDGFPEDDIAGENIPQESRILKILYDLEVLKTKGIEQKDALERMAEQEGRYDSVILKTANAVLGGAANDAATNAPSEVSLTGLEPGHVLISNIETTEGKLLVSAGNKLNAPVIERLINYHKVTKIKEPIKVFLEE